MITTLRSRYGATTAWTATAAAALGWSALSFRTEAAERCADLQVYAGAVDHLFAGRSLYDYRRHNGDVFTYPPVAGYLLAWLHFLPRAAAEALWALLTIGCIVLVAYCFSRRPRDQGPQGVQRDLAFPLLALLLVTSSPARSNLEFGQVSALVVALTAADLLLVPGRRSGWLLGAAAAVKLTPALFIPFLWLCGRRRQAATAAVAAAVLTAAAAAVRPEESRRFWLQELPDSSRIVNSDILGNQSLHAAISRAHLPHVTALWLALGAVVAAVALHVGCRLSAAGAYPLGVVVIGNASVAVSPVSWTHHQFWLTLGALLFAPGRPRSTFAWRAAVVTVMATSPLRPGLPAPLRWPLENAHLVVALASVAVGWRIGRDCSGVRACRSTSQPEAGPRSWCPSAGRCTAPRSAGSGRP